MSDSGTTENSSNNAQDGSGDGPATQPNPVVAHMMANKLDALMWLTRIVTVVCTICHILPIFGGNPYSMYQRALLAAAATSALKLHYRLPNVQLTMEFARQLFLEDSAHYLLYCVLFLNTYPMAMSLVPVFLFALLHACSFTKTLLNLMTPGSMTFVRNTVAKLEAQQFNILRFIGSTEIFLMPACVILIFSGKASFFLPFLYYRFLSLRYSSRRNPHTRNLFSEFRYATEYMCAKPQVPQFLRNILMTSIGFISRLAPQVPQ